MQKNKLTIATHDVNFHADDVCAVATFMLGFEKNNPSVEFEVVRTRNPEKITVSDCAIDIGGIDDPTRDRFDHHQIGGAGGRPNGIPYASFGLVWKKYGETLTSTPEVAASVDERLVQPVDASDNGVSISEELFENIRPYDVSALIGAMNLNWDEEGEENRGAAHDKAFLVAVAVAKQILLREIARQESNAKGGMLALKAYESASDKRIVVLDQYVPFEKVMSQKPEPLFVVYPKGGVWYIKAVRDSVQSFKNRKDLPAAWAGKRGEELAAVTGVPGSIFCHNKLFAASHETKEGAIRMVEIAIGF